MTLAILTLAGGVGLFLLGMALLTDGLRGLAGGALRRLLARFTTTPLIGAATGAAATAIIQSSSAVTVTVVGFVGAGLMTFPQALGVIFGANIGTTITGWLVATLGFKLQLGQIAMPLVLIGVMLRLYGPLRMRHLGWALAGFGLLFVGIETLRDAMAPFEGAVTPQDFPQDSFFGRLQLVGIGIVATLITQSSSAGVAVALAALGAGAISFPQAAAMVIGMDVGTTFTAALATLGGATATRRTGYAHVIYNLMTGVMALLLLGPYTAIAEAWIVGGVAAEPELALVAFHSSFNVIGVILALPFTRQFARLIERLAPETGPPLLRGLDDQTLADPASAVDALSATLRRIAIRQSETLAALLNLDRRRRRRAENGAIEPIRRALEMSVQFADRIPPSPEGAPVRRRHAAALHALDHCLRLSERSAQLDRVGSLSRDRRLGQLAAILRDAALRLKTTLAEDGDLDALETRLNRVRHLMRDRRQPFRRQMIEKGVRSVGDADETIDLLDSVRWLHRCSYHLWRIAHHLDEAGREAEKASAPGAPTEPAALSTLATSSAEPL